MNSRTISVLALFVIVLSTFTVFNNALITYASTTETEYALTISLSKILKLDSVPDSDNTIIAGGMLENNTDLSYWNINAEFHNISYLPSGAQIFSKYGLYIRSSTGFVLWQTLDPNAVEAVKGYKMLFGILVAPRTTAEVVAFVSYTTSSGGGCPLLYVWNGSTWIFDNNLLPKDHLGYSKDRYLLTYTQRKITLN